MIAVYSGDRLWRGGMERALRACGVVVRPSSRPAELAKCLADGAVRLVVAGPAPRDADEATRTAGATPVIATSPGDTTEVVARRAIGMLASGGASGGAPLS